LLQQFDSVVLFANLTTHRSYKSRIWG